jgi:hypothetical protein
MNTTEFIQLHSIIGNETQININYDRIGVTNVGVISGITVTVITKKDINSSLVGDNILDITTALQQVETVEFTIEGVSYKLKITNRSKYTSTSGNNNLNYYYFTVDPFRFNITQINYSNIQVTFEPLILGGIYTYNEYNPIISNAQQNRQSTTIRQADRTNSSTNPTNFEEILAVSSEPAQVQDSNYTATGWSNARYAGTNTSAENYRGIVPAITGKTFLGEVYTSTIPDELICSRSISDRTLIELLHTSDQELPATASYVSSSFVLSSAISTTTAQVIQVSLAPSFQTKIPVEIGSIVKINSELLRVESIQNLQNSNELTVVRGYLSTTPTTHATGRPLLSTPNTKVFSFEGTNANIVANSNNKIWIKDNRQVLYTDAFGVIHGGSVCPL